MAFSALSAAPGWKVISLLTTVTEDYERIAMHGVRTELLREQAEAAGLPLRIVMIPAESTNETYEMRMGQALEEARADGIRTAAFGDLFLADVRSYRERMLSRGGMTAIFPLWGRPTPELARDFIDAGYRAVLTCVDTTQLDAAFAGREFDQSLLDDLPPKVDPCGENGEFHTFVYDGPCFSAPVGCSRGVQTLRDDRFQFCDLL